MYYLNDRNLVQTAKAMNMHRSSLNYRFERLNELLGKIPESPAERTIISSPISSKIPHWKSDGGIL